MSGNSAVDTGSGREEMLVCASSMAFSTDLRTVTFKESYHCTADPNARRNGSLIGSPCVCLRL